MICRNCQEGHTIQGEHITYVSREMAIDAGDPSLEGSVYDREPIWLGCNCCRGDYQNCPNCSDPLPQSPPG